MLQISVPYTGGAHHSDAVQVTDFGISQLLIDEQLLESTYSAGASTACFDIERCVHPGLNAAYLVQENISL